MTEKHRITRREFLKGSLVAGGAALLGGFGYRSISRQLHRDSDPQRSQAFLQSIPPAENPNQIPNIIIILADDLGYGDLGVYGSGAIATPNIDRMAAEGARLTNACSSAPLCSPSRAGLLTGRYPIRTMVTGSLYPSGSPMNLVMDLAGFYTYGVQGIPEDEILFPETLQRRGYTTALLGKWHLGDHSPHLPNENGFDLFYGALYSNGMKPYQIFRNTEVEIDDPVDQNQLTQILTAEALDFIAAQKSNPFFLLLAHPMPHEPIHASPDFRGTSAAGLYGAAVQEIDWSIGQILGALVDHDLDHKTLVIVTSDNGPWWQGNPGFTRGRKNLPFEGGFRVPLIARWPGEIPAGIVSDVPSMNFDLCHTCLSLACAPIPEDRALDGKNLLPLLKGEVDMLHDQLYYFKGNTLVGVRQGNWKYMRRHTTDNGGYMTLSQGPFLFNLEIDPNESYSQIESRPEIARQLAQLLDQFDAEIDSNIRGWR